MEKINKDILYCSDNYYIRISRINLLLKCFLYKNHCYYQYLKNTYDFRRKMCNEKCRGINNILKTNKNIIHYENDTIYLKAYFIKNIINYSFTWGYTKEGSKYWQQRNMGFQKIVRQWLFDNIKDGRIIDI